MPTAIRVPSTDAVMQSGGEFGRGMVAILLPAVKTCTSLAVARKVALPLLANPFGWAPVEMEEELWSSASA